MPRQSSLPFAEAGPGGPAPTGGSPERVADPDEEFRAAMDAALGFLTGRARSCSEVRQHLRKKGFRALADGVEARLLELGLLDDLDLARSCVEDAISRRGVAPGGLAAELAQRGIDPELAARAIDEATPNGAGDEGPGRPELERALEVATRRLRVLHGDPASVRRRLWGFLSRRGYDAEVVENVCSQLLGSSFD
ncbi:MAG TPA: regulatory protein RecX [Actinomycetota bacterium]|nr:regulatory protein RecX [Actinomycetota bacterium]